MIISIAEKNEYIPEWNGNRELSAGEQIKITHKSPTVSIKERVNPRVFDVDSDGKVSGQMVIDRRKVLVAMVTSIANLGYSDSSKEHKIATVDQLFSAPAVFDPLIEEIYGYLQELLNDKVDEKN